MKQLFITCVCTMFFLLMACTEDHSFTLDEKRQIIEVHKLLRLYIESDSLQTEENQMYRVCKKNEYDTKTISIFSLQHKSPELSIEKMNNHGIYKQTQIIKLYPNRKYTITHSGMGGRVFIQKYFWTDSKGILRVDSTRKTKVGYRDK